jgi:hypothetical protein
MALVLPKERYQIELELSRLVFFMVVSHFYLKFNFHRDFSSRFLKFVEEGVPPNTFYAIENIINDILQ